MLGPVRDRPMPEPTYMSREQTASYLTELRKSSSLSRPSGSRPAPPSRFSRLQHRDSDCVNAVSTTAQARPAPTVRLSMPIMPSQQLHHRQTEPNLAAMNQMKKSPFAGRALARASPAPTTAPAPAMMTAPSQETPAPRVRRTPSMAYMEYGQRWMEKQEAHSLRRALEHMDLEEERRIHAAAQDEASELVWKHQNPNAAIKNPDIVVADLRSHLRKGSYARSISLSSNSTGGQRSASGGSNRSASSTEDARPAPLVITRKASPPSGIMNVLKRRTSSGKSYDNLAQAVAGDIASAVRRVSGGSGRRVLSSSGKKFMHPEDRIWEDPQEVAEPSESGRRSAFMPAPALHALISKEKSVRAEPEQEVPALPTHVRKNPFARMRMQHNRLERVASAPALPKAAASEPAPAIKHHRVEIQRNPPSQSRNPEYTSNQPLPSAVNAERRNTDEKLPEPTQAKEMRGDDIRAATSKSRNDYSPNLPRPTLVSDKPGRPIVSFQRDRHMQEVKAEEIRPSPFARPPSDSSVRRHAREGSGASISSVLRPATSSFGHAPIPRISVDASDAQPSIPTICLPDDDNCAPAITVSDAPSVHVSGPPSISISAAPSIRVSGAADRQHAPTIAPAGQLHHNDGPSRSSLHMTPSLRQSGARCAHCALPIAGRTLSAAGGRFHPGCFVCHECHTNLECVAFYPEPEAPREARLESAPMDTAPRFFCHLDFHELFSPRCKSCKTPIEGEVIVACGAEWHAGHFFCAQCGDPFDAATPFVEKDGYAWCVGCHTNRYSPKCRGCRKPVIDLVVKALGKDWHAKCFVCTECKAEFDDGRYFLRGEEEPVCVRCEERRLKA